MTEGKAEPGVAAKPVAWRCFHCDEVFTDEHCARLHFGSDEGRTPACQIKGSEIGLVEALRRAEKDAADAWFAIHNESTDAAQAHYAQSARHQEQLRAMEQTGYDRGVADCKAHPEAIGLYSAAALTTLQQEVDTLREVEAALKNWVGMQSRDNTSRLYSAALAHFKITPVIE